MTTIKTYIVTTDSTIGTEIHDTVNDEYYDFIGTAIIGWFQAISKIDAIQQAKESNVFPHRLSREFINEHIELSAFEIVQ